MATAQTISTNYVKAANGVTFAYRLLGPTFTASDKLPLVMHIHFRANMDFWDPLLLNAISAHRPVLIFDQSGVGRSTGDVATTYQGWADNVIALCDALKLGTIDLLGFSMGGCAVQMVALTRPAFVRRLVICGSGPSQPDPDADGTVAGIVWPRDVPPLEAITALKNAETNEEIEQALAVSFFPHTDAGRAACRAYLARTRAARVSESSPEDQPLLTFLSSSSTNVQRKAYFDWSTPNPRNSFPRLHELRMPVLVLNGDDDLLIPTSRSWELVKGIDDCQLIIYPKAGHGFIWQYAERVAQDIHVFLEQQSLEGPATAKL